MAQAVSVMNSHEKIQLDRRIPFVAAVFDFAAGNAPIDTAIDTLCMAEEKYGVMLLGGPYGARVSDFFVPCPNKVPCSLEEALNLLDSGKNYEEYERFLELFCMDDSAEKTLNENRLFPFLSELCFVMSGGRFEDYCVVSVDPVFVGYSWRWWGGVMAEWANTTKVLPPPPPSYPRKLWNYIDFYSDCDVRQFLEDYDEWAKAVCLVIDDRTARLRSKLKFHNNR